MAPVDENAVRAELWARQQVWQRQQMPLSKADSTREQGPTQHLQQRQKQMPAASEGAIVRKHVNRQQQQLQAPGSRKPVVTRKVEYGAKKPAAQVQVSAPGRRITPQKPSETLPRRLGLGRISDMGGGQVKGRTRFASAYKSGSLGQWLRVDQNGARPDLAFVVNVEMIPLSVVLPLCFDGLSESTHPLCLLARRGSARLLEEHPGARGKSEDMKQALPQIVGALRNALACKERDVVRVAVEHTSLLARVAQELLADHLEKLLPPLSRLAFGGSPLTSKALDAIRDIDNNVPGSKSKIKAKLPSYD